MANRSDVIIKKTKRGKVQTHRYGNTSGKECHAEGSRNKIQEFTCSYTRNVYSVNWSQWTGNKMLKEKCGGHARKTLKRFTKIRQTLYV
jgi:hypothetical protein